MCTSYINQWNLTGHKANIFLHYQEFKPINIFNCLQAYLTYEETLVINAFLLI